MTIKIKQNTLQARCGNSEGCLREGTGRVIEIPGEVFDGSGSVREKFKGSVLPSGVYVSSCGYFYCSRECWSNFCGD